MIYWPSPNRSKILLLPLRIFNMLSIFESIFEQFVISIKCDSRWTQYIFLTWTWVPFYNFLFEVTVLTLMKISNRCEYNTSSAIQRGYIGDVSSQRRDHNSAWCWNGEARCRSGSFPWTVVGGGSLRLGVSHIGCRGLWPFSSNPGTLVSNSHEFGHFLTVSSEKSFMCVQIFLHHFEIRMNKL